MKTPLIAGFAAVIVVVGVSSGPSPATPQSGSALTEKLDSIAGAGVREDRAVVRPFNGDGSQLVGIYKGPGRGKEMVIQVTATPEGVAFALNGASAIPLTWVEGWTFRDTISPSALLIFRRSTNSGPAGPEQSRGATELRFDRGGGYFILKRQEKATKE